MASVADFPARGKVTSVQPDRVVFNPSGTNYQLHLLTGGAAYAGPTDVPVDALVRVQARKLWAAPSGGNFVAPIFGPPRTIQGRVKFAGGGELVVQAGAHFVVTVPAGDPSGPGAADFPVGSLVNVTAMPGARLDVAAGV